MRALFGCVAGVVAVAHAAFLAYLVCGGFVALRYRRTIAVHIAAVGWALASLAAGLWCPLTGAERWARAQARMAPLDPGGFIEHYLTGVLYPAWATGYVQAAVFGAIGVSWYLYLRGRRRTGTAPRFRHEQHFVK